MSAVPVVTQPSDTEKTVVISFTWDDLFSALSRRICDMAPGMSGTKARVRFRPQEDGLHLLMTVPFDTPIGALCASPDEYRG